MLYKIREINNFIVGIYNSANLKEKISVFLFFPQLECPKLYHENKL